MVKRKKMLTVEDLYRFCLENNFAKFSAKESGYQLAVQVPTTFEVDDTSDDNHRGMMRLKFRILHDGKNRNGSFVPHDAAVKASNTIADRPIMAAIHQLDDGSWDFKSHEMEIIENDEGELEINYIEKQVGSFSSEKPFWEHDDEYNKDYLCAYGYIAEEYTKAADIIRNKGWTKNSCELVIEEMSFNAKEKQLELNEFYLSASTLLGREDDGTEIGEGMLGSRADIVDFSVANNSVFSQNEKVIKLLSELNEKLDGLNIDLYSGRKEDNPKTMFEKLLEKYNKTIEEIDFEYEGLSDEELEVVFAEHFTPSTENFEDNPKKRKKDEDDTVIVDDDDNQDDDDDDNQDDDDDKEPVIEEPVVEQSNTEEPVEEQSETENPTDNPEEVSYYSVAVTHGDKTQTFAVSLQDKIEALYNLVNDTYAEADGCFYDCTVYDDDKYVIMHSWWTDDAYKQSYKVKKDIYSLVGDRVRVKAVWCTEDEQKALENMRANYSAIEEKLAKYESEPAKKEILQSEDWKNIRETKEFVELSKRENYFDLSTDELTNKLDKMLLEYSKHNKIEFSSEEPKKKQVGMKLFGNPTKKSSKGTGRYGGIFTK